MPTYVYKNDETGVTRELTLSLTAKANLGTEFQITDLNGHTDTWKQVFTAAPVHFKGSGFYSTSSKA